MTDERLLCVRVMTLMREERIDSRQKDSNLQKNWVTVSCLREQRNSGRKCSSILRFLIPLYETEG